MERIFIHGWTRMKHGERSLTLQSRANGANADCPTLESQATLLRHYFVLNRFV